MVIFLKSEKVDLAVETFQVPNRNVACLYENNSEMGQERS